MTSIVVRPLTSADESFCQKLSATAGWNQTPADWRRARELEPEGAWVAVVEGCEAGTATACRFGSIGWIALMLVAPEFRRRGVGNTLFTRAVQYLESHGCHQLRLDATPLGQPLYTQHGFVAEYVLGRFAGIVTQPASPNVATTRADNNDPFSEPRLPRTRMTLARAELSDLDAIAALDQQITQTPRRDFLAQLFSLDPASCRVARTAPNDSLAGYAFSRPGRLASQLGPCLATEDDAGRVLLEDLLQQHLGRAVYVDIPLDHVAATEIAQRYGLQLQRHLTRMGKGPRVFEKIDKLWSGSGPEKG